MRARARRFRAVESRPPRSLAAVAGFRGSKTREPVKTALTFTVEHPVRRTCIQIVESSWFTATSTLLIILACVAQCFYHPLEPADSGINAAIGWTSLALTAAFTVEIAVKVVAWGFILDNGETPSSLWKALLARGKRSAAGGPSRVDQLKAVVASAVQPTSVASGRQQQRSAEHGGTSQDAKDSVTLAIPTAPEPSAAATGLQPPEQQWQQALPQVLPPAAPQQQQQQQQQALPSPSPPLEQRQVPQVLPPPSPQQPPPQQQALPSQQPQGIRGRGDSAKINPSSLGPSKAQNDGGALTASASARLWAKAKASPLVTGADLEAGAAEKAAMSADDAWAACLPPGRPRIDPRLEDIVWLAGGARIWQEPQLLRRSAPRGPFLRDPWGVLDFSIVLLCWLSFVPGVGQGAAAMRAVRLLLPLRSITSVPGMQACVGAVLQSLPMLGTVLLAMLFVLWCFAILGLQLFMDALHNNCFVLGADDQPLPFPPSGDGNYSTGYTPPQNAGQMCSTLSGSLWGGTECPVNSTCLGGGMAPQLGQLSFDNIFSALFYDFLILSTMWWGQVTSYLQEATVGWSYFYSLLIVLLGWFLLSLVLAALGDKYFACMETELQSPPKPWWSRRPRAPSKQPNNRTDAQQGDTQPAAGSAPPQKGGSGVGWRQRLTGCWTALPGRLKGCWGALPGPGDDESAWVWRKTVHAAVLHWVFETAVVACVLANTVLLAMPYYGMPQSYADALEVGNSVLTFVFVAEATVKILALGRTYFEDAFNVYDCVITSLSLASFCAGFGAGSGLSALRVLRVLRVLRLFTALPALQRFLKVLKLVLLRTLPFFCIVFLVVFFFASLGMMLFGGAWTSSDPGAPRLNFNSFGASLATVYDCLTGTLDMTMFYAMYTTSGWAALYYVSLTVLGSFLVLNLLIVVLFELFKSEKEAQEKKEKGKEQSDHPIAEWLKALWGKLRGSAAAESNTQASRFRTAGPRAISATGRKRRLKADEPPPLDPDCSIASGKSGVDAAADRARLAADKACVVADVHGMVELRTDVSLDDFAWVEDLVKQEAEPETALMKTTRDDAASSLDATFTANFHHKSFGVLPPTSAPRRALYSVVHAKYFEWLVLLVILFNCGVMAVENPGNSASLASTLSKLELACLGFYVAEMGAKLLALGAWADKGSYFRSPWNCLDCVVVTSSALASLLAASSWATVFGAFRALRALRLVSKLPAVQAVICGLCASVTGMTHVLLVAALFQVAFATMGLQLFMGKLHACDHAWCQCTDPQDMSTCVEVVTRQDCSGVSWINAENPAGGDCRWSSAVYNFDNLWDSFTTLTVISTGSAWAEVMHRAVDSVAIGRQPDKEASGWAAAFFVIYQCLGQFFIVNLFVSVILDNYIEQTQAKGPGIMQTETQKAWVNSMRLLLRDTPSKKEVEPKGKLRQKLFKLVEHDMFTSSILYCIVLSGIALNLQHYQQGPGWDQGIYIANACFTVIFCVESLLKLGALGRRYWCSGWNIFDALVTWGSVPSLFLPSTGASFAALRSIRILRLARMVQYFTGLKRIATTLLLSLPTIINAILALLIFLFVFSVLGCQLFYGIEPKGGMTPFFNWQSVGNTLMMLSVAATGDAWDAFLADTAAQPPGCGIPPAGKCGAPLASLYFLPFMLLVSFLLLGILLAVVYEAYDSARPPPMVREEQFLEYKRLWCDIDRDHTHFIHRDQLHGLLEQLDKPMGYRGGPAKTEEDTKNLIRHLEEHKGLEMEANGSIYYHQLLQALTAKAAKINIKELGDALKAALAEETVLRKKRHQAENKRRRTEAFHASHDSTGSAPEARARLMPSTSAAVRPPPLILPAVSGTDLRRRRPGCVPRMSPRMPAAITRSHSEPSRSPGPPASQAS